MPLEAFLLAAFAQSSLLISGLVAYRVRFSKAVIGCLAAFGAGSLISAVSFDLIPEAEGLSNVASAFWLLAGVFIYLGADRVVETKFASGDSGDSPLGIVVGSVVDGVPESLIFGIAVTTGDPISIAFVAAVWVSNVPQALGPSADLAEQGWSIVKTASMWGAVVLACALTALLGYAVGENVSGATGATAAAVAAGGVLAMLTDSLMPFSYSKGGQQAGLWTVVGFTLTLAMV